MYIHGMAKSSAGFKNHFQIIFITLHFQQSFCRQWQKTRFIFIHTQIHTHTSLTCEIIANHLGEWTHRQTDMEANHGTWLKASLAIAASMSAVGAHVNWLINLLLISDRKTLKNLRITKILPQNFWMKFSVFYVFEKKNFWFLMKEKLRIILYRFLFTLLPKQLLAHIR